MESWTLRAAGAADGEFLFQVYSGTRLEELAATGWDSAQQEAFLRMQFAAQNSHYRRYFPAARFEIVQAGGIDVGRFYVDRGDCDIRLLDIALLPEYRRRGLGGALLRALLVEAAASKRTVSIHVERNNPALKLYLRLGFLEVDDDGGVYRRMQWRAPAGGELPVGALAEKAVAA